VILPAPSSLKNSQAKAKSNHHAGTEETLLVAVRGAAKKMPRATPMNARASEARWRELQRQRKLLLAEAEEAEQKKKILGASSLATGASGAEHLDKTS